MTDHRRTTCVVGLAILLVAANAPRLGAQASPGSTPYIDSEHGLTIEEAGAMIGLSRGAAYEAAKKGEIPTLNFGGLKIVPKTAWLRKLGIDSAA